MADEDLPPMEEQGAEGVPAEIVEQQPDEQPGEDTEQQPLTVEDLAADMGWSPKENWRGDPDKWKPAHEFVRHTVDVNRNLSGSIKRLESRVETMARTSAKLTEDAVAKARQDALAERQRAFDEGDNEAFQQAEQKLRQIEAQPAPTPPETQDFVERNAWFGKDAEATQWATTRAGELAQQGFSPARQLAIVEREAKQYFPEHFEEAAKPAAAKPAPLSRPGVRSSAPAKKGFSSLPAEVKSAALDYEKRGVCTKEEYAETYYQFEGSGQ